MFDHETCSHPIRWYSEDVLYFVQILRKSSFQETLFNHFLRHAFAARLISVLSSCNSGMSSICCTNCSVTVLLGFLFIAITSFCARQVNLRISLFSWVLHLSRRIFTWFSSSLIHVDLATHLRKQSNQPYIRVFRDQVLRRKGTPLLHLSYSKFRYRQGNRQ